MTKINRFGWLYSAAMAVYFLVSGFITAELQEVGIGVFLQRRCGFGVPMQD